MLVAAGFAEIRTQVKENAAEFIKGWMPGSGAEKYITSAYVTAIKPTNKKGIRDDVRKGVNAAEVAIASALAGGGAEPTVEAGC